MRKLRRATDTTRRLPPSQDSDAASHAAARREDDDSCVVGRPERDRLGEKLMGAASPSSAGSVGSRFCTPESSSDCTYRAGPFLFAGSSPSADGCLVDGESAAVFSPVALSMCSSVDTSMGAGFGSGTWTELDGSALSASAPALLCCGECAP